MSFTAVYEPAAEGGFTCWVEEIPAAISEGVTIEEAESNLMEALKLVQECQPCMALS
ncbi:MAG: type II toxin-antitoxin system HicB family antitoxin [Verrucomicrobia bacterium]|nr:type II toxin-antitoxin system HicB family antitoxin [Verrucomicrobiota bacterium]